ncbi:MAG: hypothetical protein NTX16_13870 [Actinobacteria bacterium]|nr:hypothetical protein [Actinomycetota bacterium]
MAVRRGRMNQYGHSPVTYYRGEDIPPAYDARAPLAGVWRRPIALALVVVGCLMAPAALAGAYVHRDIMDVEGYVAAITPVADDPAVQKAVANVLAKQVSGALDADQALPDGLPAELDEFTGPLSGQLEDLTRELTLEAVSSNEFRELWAAANRRVHPVLVDAIKSKGKLNVTTSDLVGVDLAEVTANVTDLLASSGVALPGQLPQALTSGDVMLLDSRPLATAGAAILALDRLYPVLQIATLAFLLLSVLVAPRRLLAAVYLGAGLTLAMVVLEAGLAVGRARYLGATDDVGVPHAASAAIWAAITSSLRLWGWATLVIGVAVAVAAALALLVLGRSTSRPQQSRPVSADYLYPPGETPYPGGPGYPERPPPPGGPGYTRAN